MTDLTQDENLKTFIQDRVLFELRALAVQKKISDLPDGGVVLGTEEGEFIKSGVSVKQTIDQIKTYIGATTNKGVELTASRNLLNSDINQIVFNQTNASYSYTVPDNLDLTTMPVGDIVTVVNTDFNGEIVVTFPDGVGYNGNSTAGISSFSLKNVGATTLIVRESATNYITSTRLAYDTTTEVLGTGDHVDFCAQVQAIAPSVLHRRQNGVSANRPLVQTDLGVLLYANGANYTLSLPAVGDSTLNSGASFYVCQRDASALTVQAPAGVTLNGVDGGAVTTPGERAYGIFFRQGPLTQNSWLYFDLTTIGLLPQTPNAVLFNDNSGNVTDSSQLTTNTILEVSNFPTLQKLKMTSDDAFVGFSSVSYNDNPAAINHFIRARGRGTESAPQALQSEDNVAFDIAAGLVDDAGIKKFLIGGTRVFRTDETPTSTACPMSYLINVANDDTGSFSTFNMFSRGAMKLVGSGTGQLDLQFSDFVNIIDGDLKFDNQTFFISSAKQVLANTYCSGTTDTTVFINGLTYDKSFISVSDAFSDGIVCELYNNSGSDASITDYVKGRGTSASPLAIQNGDLVHQTRYSAVNTSLNKVTGAAINGIVNGIVSATAVPIELQLNAFNDDDGTFTSLSLKPDGSASLQGFNGTTRNFTLNFEESINVITNDLQLNGANFFDGISPTTTKGDLVVHNGTGNVRLAVGADGFVPFADSTSAEGISYQRPLGRFSQTASVSVINTLTETSIVSTGEGSLSTPANSLKVGDSFTAKLGGTITTQGAGQDLTFRVKAGLITLIDTGTIPLTNIGAAAGWEIEIDFVIRQIGAATVASIVSNLNFDHGTSSTFTANVVNNTTFDTTIAQTLDVTAQWGSTGASNNLTCDFFTLFKVF